MLPRADLKPVHVMRNPSVSGIWGSEDADLYTVTETLGWIQPLSARSRAQLASAGAGLPVPAYVAYLVPTAPVREPGFTLHSQGVTYYPVGDAEDVGGVGEYWRVQLRAPGEVMGSG